ncbi:MAG TPA: DEAD/DEAH box helicase [bacterium]|nr:DEAD/DEAH box helicase [bacterium]
MYMQRSRQGFGGRGSSFGRPSFGGTSSRNFGSRNSNFRSSFSKPKRERGEHINPALFIKKAVEALVETPVTTRPFTDFNLCPEIQTNLLKKNYSVTTPVQDAAIEPILAGRDLIGLANTGTGKTAAFLLPLINKAFFNRTEKVLIIAPTRELALQIETEFRQFSWSMRLFSAACVGGMPIYHQINNLKRNPQFVIGTPGRLKDLSDRGLIEFGTFKNIVLDEVDRMLDMGFVDEIKAILAALPKERQSLFFSATMPPKIKELAAKVLSDPVTVEVKTGQTAQNVDQDIVRVRNSSDKYGELTTLLSKSEVKKALIFIETKREVEKVTEQLVSSGFRAQSIHGDKKQRERQRALTQFRNDAINVLVATDVAARGLDIKDITHVINYTIPQTYDDYVHRIGRTGRGSSKGFALTFV